MSVPKFCPEDGTILKPKEEEDEKKGLHLIFHCEKCNYFENGSVYQSTIYTNEPKNVPFPLSSYRYADLQHNPTYKRTKKLPCFNPKCPSKKKKENPEIVLVATDKKVEVMYLCTVCEELFVQ